MKIKDEDIIDRHKFRKQVKKFKDFEKTDEEMVKTKRSYMEEQNKKVSKRMKKYWPIIKTGKQKPLKLGLSGNHH